MRASNPPTDKQIKFLNDLCETVGMSQDELYAMAGWYESSPWGIRTANERITKTSVSAMIKVLINMRDEMEDDSL